MFNSHHKTPTKNPSKLGVLQEGEEPSISHSGIVGGEGPSAHRQSFVPIINPPSPPKSILKKNKTQGGKLVTWKDRISNPPPYKDTIKPLCNHPSPYEKQGYQPSSRETSEPYGSIFDLCSFTASNKMEEEKQPNKMTHQRNRDLYSLESSYGARASNTEYNNGR